ncbi:MAG: hypothetical protein ABIP49_03180 [Lysobacterales bacterium]
MKAARQLLDVVLHSTTPSHMAVLARRAPYHQQSGTSRWYRSAQSLASAAFARTD